MPKAVKRPGHGSGRVAAKELSRQAIAASARTLFRERGYSEATMEAIAADAGYAVQTVYFHFGSKAAILTFLIDEIVVEAVSPRHERLMSSPEAAEIVSIAARIAREAYGRGWDLLAALRDGKSDPI